MQWSLIALAFAFICRKGLRYPNDGPSRLLQETGCSPLAQVAATASAVLFAASMACFIIWHTWPRALILYLITVTVVVLILCVGRLLYCRRSQRAAGKLASRIPWVTMMVILQLAVFIVTVRFAGDAFLEKQIESFPWTPGRAGLLRTFPIPAEILAISIALGILSGSFLIGSALAGMRVGLRCLNGGESQAWLPLMRHAFYWIVTALTVRFFAILFTVLAGAAFNPLGWRAFLGGIIAANPFAGYYWLYDILAVGFSLVFIRILIGFLFPLMMLLMGQAALHSRLPRPAALQFIPLALFIIFGEFYAAAITAGLWGLAF